MLGFLVHLFVQICVEAPIGDTRVQPTNYQDQTQHLGEQASPKCQAIPFGRTILGEVEHVSLSLAQEARGIESRVIRCFLPQNC